jgi:argininosuccinate lyase
MAGFAIENLKINLEILNDPKYDYVFSVEEVNRLVLQGIPFRDAYKIIGEQIEKGEYRPVQSVHHTHEGSIGNLCLDKISERKNIIMAGFSFEKVDEAIKELTSIG